MFNSFNQKKIKKHDFWNSNHFKNRKFEFCQPGCYYKAYSIPVKHYLSKQYLLSPFWRYWSSELQSLTKYLRQTTVFIWNSALRKKLNICILRDFYWSWQNFHFGTRPKYYAISEVNFEILLIFSNFLRL